MNTPIIDVTLASDKDRAPPQKTVEAVLRRALKISDPNNVQELSRGLLMRYQKDAVLIDRERKGLPFTVVKDLQGKLDMAKVLRPEVADSQADMERVLQELAQDPALAEVAAEMRGWARSIRSAMADGFAAARFALDPHSSDRAMTARRTLGDYARISRYAAALATCGSNVFCRLAQACDAVASVILVLLGQGLAEAGVTPSTHIPRVPLATLRQRRDTVITELQLLHRNAAGGLSPDTWPRGTVSLIQIYDQLATSDAADLRSLLDEGYLSRQLDELLDMAADGSIDGLKALGAVATLTVRRFRRFISVVSSQISPPSPPLTRFVAALTLFVQGFAVSAGGYRLPFLARSPLLAGLATLSGTADKPTRDLMQIAMARSVAAEWLDCLCCSCEDDDARNIILFAKIIYDLDRAIDLYCFGTDPGGEGDAEIRAGAYGVLIDTIDTVLQTNQPTGKFSVVLNKKIIPLMQEFSDSLNLITASEEGKRRAGMMRDLLCQQLKEEKASARLVASISAICRQDLILEVLHGHGIATVIDAARLAVAVKAGLLKPGVPDTVCGDAEFFMPPDHETALTMRATSPTDVFVKIIDTF